MGKLSSVLSRAALFVFWLFIGITPWVLLFHSPQEDHSRWAVALLWVGLTCDTLYRWRSK